MAALRYHPKTTNLFRVIEVVKVLLDDPDQEEEEQNSGTKHSFIDLCPLLLLSLHVQELSFFFDLNCAACKVQLELPRSVLFSQEQMRRKTLSS